MDNKDVVDIPELTRALHASAIGAALEITYWRGDARLTTQVTPAESPPPQ
jgi:S1-C subfamily serine protease